MVLASVRGLLASSRDSGAAHHVRSPRFWFLGKGLGGAAVALGAVGRDAWAVLDAVGSERAVLLGLSDGGPIAILFAASHPHRTRGMILVNTAASFSAPGDFPETRLVGFPDA